MILNRDNIKKLLPHRDPFLFVDEVTEFEEWKRVVANYTFVPEAPFFKGHFPGMPIVPGVLLVEAMAQVGGLLAYKSDGITWRERSALLLRLDKAVFRRIVKPGEKIVMEIVVEHKRDPMTKFKGKCTVDGERCAEAMIVATFTDPILTMEETS